MDINGLLNSLGGFILGISLMVATIAIMLLGIKTIFTFYKGGGLREVLSGVGVIFVGMLLVSLAGAIAGAIMAIGKQLSGAA